MRYESIVEPQRFELTAPDDWHLHLRDEAALADVVGYSARVFRRAIVMPNLRPPITTVDQAHAYRERILAAIPVGHRFEPLMTLYLTAATPPSEIEAAHASPWVHAAKLYPAGATTGAEAGIADLSAIDDVLRTMERLDVPLLVHGESIDPAVDVFDREAVFLDQTLTPLCQRFPGLRIVVEHITTAEAVDFVTRGSSRIAATVTAHHLLYDRNAMFRGGIRPHFYCLPVLKRERHRSALLQAATSGNPKFFLGTDSAPHLRTAKEAACGCAGIFTAHAALPLYAEAFESVGSLHRLEGFASHHGPDFYGLPRNDDRIALERTRTAIPMSLTMASGDLIPLRAGDHVAWRVCQAITD